ncbi:MAG: S9 family peptidase [Candidatus Velthaea sp.]
MKARWYCLLAAALGVFVVAPAAQAAPRPALGIDDIFAAEPLLGRLPAAITWAPDGSRFLYTLPGGGSGPVDTHVYTLRTGRDAVFFRASAEGKGARPVAEFVWSAQSTKLAFLDAGNLFVINADGTGRTKIADGADDPQWSADGSRIAYVHASDIYAVPLRGGRAVRYSTDGTGDAPNGEPDWVYSEELDMRHAFRWSPDNAHIAYLHVDQRPIAPFPIVDFLGPQNVAPAQRYPLAGGKNSIVTLRVAAPGGATRTLYSTKAADDYIASLGWTPHGDPTAQILDRSQKRLRYVEFAARARTLLTQSDKMWVDLAGEPKWLKDAHRFLFTSERDGQASLYLADARGGVPVRLTHGYRVESIEGVDESRGMVYVAAAWPTRRNGTMLAVPLGGGEPRALAGGAGSHAFKLAPDARSYVRIDSAFDTPPSYAIGKTAGGTLRSFARSKPVAGRGFGKTQLLEVDSRLGKLDAWMITPPDFDPSKTYPVVMQVYGGPAAPTTRDTWDGASYLYHQALAQHGFIVFSIDGPGSQIDSAAAVRTLYHNFGPGSLAGQLAGVEYLKTLPYVDAQRIGIWGWSFGGYETTYAMTHAPGVWKTGVAVAPVTDWKFYDTIYTERYMGTPQANPKAYARSSVLEQAGALRGHLLISHGTSDDNVHLSNTMSLVQAFILKGKQVDMMVYPRKTHGISGIPQRRHLFTHMLDYWEQNL